jgi:hypothetical protein
LNTSVDKPRVTAILNPEMHPTVGSRTGLAFGCGYDVLGRRATESYPGGQNVYTYDVEGRQTGRTGAYTESSRTTRAGRC